MTNKKILLLLLPFVLACSITAPAAQIAEPFPTEQKSPTPSATGIPAYTATATDATVETCKVTAGALNLRDSPDLAGYKSHVIAWLYAGDVLTILSDPPVENWITVQAENLTGWINSKFCERLSP